MIYFLSLRSLVNGCGGQFPTLVIANAVRRAAIHLSPKGITDSFTLRVQNDKPISHCGAGVLWTPLRSRSTDRAGGRDRRKACGNPFFPSPSLRSRVNGCGNPFSFKGEADSFALTTLAVPKSCYSLGARTTFDRGARRCSLFPAPQALATSLRMTRRTKNATSLAMTKYLYNT